MNSMIDYVEMLIAELRYGVIDNMLSEARANMYMYPEELRFNPYHDPSNGRFTSGGGSGGLFSPDKDDLLGGSRKMNVAEMTKLYAGGLTKPNNGGTIKATKKQRQEIEKVLIGTNTPNGIKISGVSFHAADRIVQRNVLATEVKSILLSAAISYPGNKPDTYCVQHGGFRIVYSGSGNLISAVRL